MPAKNILTVFFLGDIIGQPGCRAVLTSLPGLRKNHAADVIIVNGENADNGFGINREIVVQLLELGVHVITTGNHIWHNKDIFDCLEQEQRLLRPCNYPRSLPGSGLYRFHIRDVEFAVINVQGRQYMEPIDCPFRRVREIQKDLKNTINIVDFHGESSTEKEAFAHYMAGDVSAVLGTHTHIQTADERIISDYTAYITDVGACGPENSVIGFNANDGVARFLQQQVAGSAVIDNEPATMHGVKLTIDTTNGACKKIERLSLQSVV